MAWSWEHLLHEYTITLGHTLNNSTITTYSSHLQSYLTFCKLHNFALKPNTVMLSFYIVSMSQHIKPNSMSQYLSGIVSSLEPHCANVQEACKSHLISCTLLGVHKLWDFMGVTHNEP